MPDQYLSFCTFDFVPQAALTLWLYGKNRNIIAPSNLTMCVDGCDCVDFHLTDHITIVPKAESYQIAINYNYLRKTIPIFSGPVNCSELSQNLTLKTDLLVVLFDDCNLSSISKTNLLLNGENMGSFSCDEPVLWDAPKTGEITVFDDLGAVQNQTVRYEVDEFPTEVRLFVRGRKKRIVLQLYNGQGAPIIDSRNLHVNRGTNNLRGQITIYRDPGEILKVYAAPFIQDEANQLGYLKPKELTLVYSGAPGAGSF